MLRSRLCGIVSILLLNCSLAPAAGENWELFLNFDQAGSFVSDGEFIVALAGRSIVRFHKTDGSAAITSIADGLPLLFGRLRQAPNGDIWCPAINSPLARYDGTRWQAADIPDKGEPIEGSVVGMTFDRSGSLWVLGERKAGKVSFVAVWRNSAWEVFDSDDVLPAAQFSDLAVAGDGSVWLVGKEREQFRRGVVARILNGDWELFGTEDGLPIVRDVSALDNLHIDRSGNVWVGGGNTGLGMFNGNRWQSWLDHLSGAPSSVRRILSDADGNVWLLGWKDIRRWDGSQWSTFNKADGLVLGSSINEMVFADDGTLWAATDRGLHSFQSGNWRYYSEADGFPTGNCHNVLFENGEILVIVDGLVERIRDQARTRFTVEDTPFGNIFTKLTADEQGNIWALHRNHINAAAHDGVTSGIGKFDGRNWQLHSRNSGIEYDSLLSDAIFDQSGRLWASALGGINLFDGESWQDFTISDTYGSRREYLNLAMDESGTLWVSSFLWVPEAALLQPAVHRFDGNEWISYSDEVGITSQVGKIAIDQSGNVWVLAHQERTETDPNYFGGLLKFDGNDWTTFDLLDERAPARKFSQDILVDTDGSLILIVSSVVAPSAAYRFDGQSWTQLRTTDGGEIFAHAVFRDRLGSILFAGADYGIAAFDGSALKRVGLPSWVSRLTAGNVVQGSDGSFWFADGVGLILLQGFVTEVEQSSDLKSDLELSLFPNPAAQASITLTCNKLAPNETLRVSIFNVLGVEVVRVFEGIPASTALELQIPTTGLQAGKYWVKLVNAHREYMKELVIIK